MAYEKPIEIKVVAPNLAGTEAKSVASFIKLENLLTKTLAAGDIFKSPPASINTQTHEVTKSLFVRKDVEKLVTDTLIAHQDLFVEELRISSKEARTKKYKVDIEGDRAMASLRANTAALGGKVYGNQNGNFIEIPSYKGSLKTATREATGITAKVREQDAKEVAAIDSKWGKLLLTRRISEAKAKEREEEKAKKEAEREELKKQKEEEKAKKQKEADDEKEKKSAETDAKHRGLTLLAGIGTSIFLLKKLVSLVENIMNGVIDAGEKSFKTTMDAMRLNIDPVVLRNLFYAGTAKGIGSAPVDMLTTMQSLFGTTLLAAENVGKIDTMAPVIGKVIGDLMRNGQAGTDPMGMVSAILDSVAQAYKDGKNALGQKGGTQSSNAASLITMIESSLGESAAQILTRMFQDIDSGKDVSSYQSWIMDAMPISSPTNAGVASAAGSYSDYLVAIAELKSIIDLIKTTLSPLLDPLTIAIQKLNGFLLKLTGDTTGVAKLSRENYASMRVAKARDTAEIKKLTSVEEEYLDRNKGLFKDSKALDKAVTNFQNGIIPEGLNDTQLKDFYMIAALVLHKKKLQSNVEGYSEKEADYITNGEAYALGQKTFAFADSDLAQSYAFAEAQFKNAMIKVDQGSFTVPATQQESYMSALGKATAAKKEKEAIDAREAQIKQMAMDELVPQLSGDPDQEFFYKKQKSKLRKKTEDSIRAELERIDSKFQEYMAMYGPNSGGEHKYTQEDSIALKNSIAVALDEASARIIVQGIDKNTDLGTATSAKVSRDEISGNLRVDLYVNGTLAKSVPANVSNTEANSLEAGDKVTIDLYQQSN